MKLASAPILDKAIDGNLDEWLELMNCCFKLFTQVEMTGLTGKIKFDQHGIRSDFILEIVELKKDGLIKVWPLTLYFLLALPF